MPILISDKADFRGRKIIRDKEGQHAMKKKRSILQENLAILNVYAPNNRPLNYIRKKLIELQGEINESTFIVRDFNIHLSKMDR